MVAAPLTLIFVGLYHEESSYLRALGGRSITPWEAVFEDGWGEAMELREQRMEEMGHVRRLQRRAERSGKQETSRVAGK